MDFPLICFFKHLFAVQLFFDDHPIFDEQPDPTPTTMPIAPAFMSPMLPVPALTRHLFDLGIPAQTCPLLMQLAEKMEVLAVHFQRSNVKVLPITDLRSALDVLMLATDNSNILPTYTQIPRSSGWDKTQQAMMPGIKVKGLKQHRTRCMFAYGLPCAPPEHSQPRISASCAACNCTASPINNAALNHAALDCATY
jgi:hypothetical protein